MALEVTIPRLGWAMEKGTFLEWRKRDGDKVKEGDVLFVIEGDKAAQEIEAAGGGVLAIGPSAPSARRRARRRHGDRAPPRSRGEGACARRRTRCRAGRIFRPCLAGDAREARGPLAEGAGSDQGRSPRGKPARAARGAGDRG